MSPACRSSSANRPRTTRSSTRRAAATDAPTSRSRSKPRCTTLRQGAPTLLATDQLSKDLLDGRLDGLNGQQPTGSAAERTYDPHSLTSELSAALAQQTTRYGDQVTRSSLPAVTAFGNTRYDSYYFDATLESSGATSTIAVATESSSDRRAPGQKTVYAGPGQSDPRGFMLYGNMGSGSLFIKTDAPDSNGGLLSVGDNRNGELGDGSAQPTGPSGPARPALPGVLTHAAGGIGHTIARLADGSVYTWGDNSVGQLGQGQNGTSLPRSLPPLRVNLPRGAIAVAASNMASFALLDDTSVWSWGSGWGFGTLGDNTASGERISPAPVLSTNGPLTGVIQLSARDNDAIALQADGTVWTWGSFSASATASEPTGIVPGNMVATRIAGIPKTTGGVRKVLTEQGLFAVLLAGSDESGRDLDGAVYSWGVHFDITANQILEDRVPRRVLNLPPVRDLMPGGFLGYGQRPSDRLTGMAIDYDGHLFKVRGRVAESYDPANPTAQRRPQGQVNRPDCDSCHVVRPKTLPPVPTTGNTCAVPVNILALLTTQSRCENCHNSAPLANGSPLGALTCAPPVLPPPSAPTKTVTRTDRCALPVAHPVIKTNAACSSCHNSVVTTPLTCSPDLEPLQPPSTTVPTITAALDNAGPVQGLIARGGITDDTTPTLQGTLSAALVAGESVSVLQNGQSVGAATATPGSATWQFEVPALATGSTYSFTARVVRNGASDGTPSGAFPLQISNQGPAKTAQVTSIADNVDPVQGNAAGGVSNDTTPTIAGTISPALAGGESIRLRRTGPGNTVLERDLPNATGSNWSFAESGLLNGVTYAYQAQAIGPSGVGPLGTSVQITIDTEAPSSQPTVRLNANLPATSLAGVAGTRANLLGLSDPTPSIGATVTGAASGDQIEFLVQINGGAVIRVPGTSLIEVPPSGSVTTALQSHTITGATAATGTATTAPGSGPISLVYSARLVDRAGNVGQPGPASTHQVGVFDCIALKRLNPSHANDPDTSATCATSGCHTQSSTSAGLMQRLPGGSLVSTSYWCTFGSNAIRLN